MIRKLKRQVRSRTGTDQPAASTSSDRPSSDQPIRTQLPERSTHAKHEQSTAPTGSTAPSKSIEAGPNYGIKILYDAGKDAVVDLVFVHGLTGNAFSTWYHKEQDVHWPRDILKHDIPDSRILTFGYDADVVNILGGGPASNSRLTNHAESLVGRLVRERERDDTEERRIIFVAHSLGGLVTEQALVHSRNSVEPHLRQIERYTSGIVFLGVPHCGSDLEAWATFGRRLVSVLKRTNKDILGVLDPDSEMLHLVENNFHNILRQRKNDPIEIAGFYEELAVEGVGEIVPQRSAKIAGYTFYPIHANHMDMTKFPSRNDNGYDTVLGETQRWVKKFRHMTQQTLQSEKDSVKATLAAQDRAKVPERESDDANRRFPKNGEVEKPRKLGDSELTAEGIACLQSFWPSGLHYKSQKNQNPVRVPNTCLWALENDIYLDWRDHDTKKLLWISADPGCGKSVLARCIIDEDLIASFGHDPSKLIVYYFFKDTSPEQRSASRAISTILYQIFDARPRLIRHALSKFQKMKSDLSRSFPELWEIFEEVATDSESEGIVCILDALDECNEQEQLELMQSLEDLHLRQEASALKIRLKLLITSRPYHNIRRGLHGLMEMSHNIALAGTDESAQIQKEINLVIKDRVAGLRRGKEITQTVADHLEQRLLTMTHRTYLWLHLTWRIIRERISGTKAEINQLIDNLPENVQAAYEALLQKSADPIFAKKVLQIILVSYRPLTLTEMNFAISVDEGTLAYPEIDEEGPDWLQTTLPGRCGLMVSIFDSKLYFAHQTVRDFLLRESEDLAIPAGRVWQHSLSPKDCHRLMTRICLRENSLPGIDLSKALVASALIPQYGRDMEPSTYCNDFIFLSYSAVYWADHFKAQETNEGAQVVQTILRDRDSESLRGRWGRDWKSVLYAAAEGGQGDVVQMLLEEGEDPDQLDDQKRTALHTACKQGHFKITGILSRYNANLEFRDDYGDTALQLATEQCHIKTVRILLNAGAKVNARGGYFGYPLTAAAYRSHEELIRMLLKAGANVNSRGGHFGLPLLAAAAQPYEQVVRILLNAGADVNARGGYLDDPFQYVPVSWNLQDYLKGTYRTGDEDESNIRNGRYCTPIQVAARKGHERVAQELLEAGADVNFHGGDFESPLQEASRHGHEETVRVLLKYKPDIDLMDGLEGSALTRACGNGHAKTVRLLLDNGADVNAESGPHSHRKSPLQQALINKRVDVIKILLDARADVSALPRGGRHALEDASWEEYQAIVVLLLKAGMTFDSDSDETRSMTCDNSSEGFNDLKDGVSDGDEE